MARYTFISFLDHFQPDPQFVDVVDNDTYYGSGVDMTLYAGVVFLVTVAKGEAANFDIKVQQDTTSDFSGDPQDLKDTKVTFATTVGADGFAFIEIRDPREPYLRPVLIAPDLVAATPASIVAIRYGKSGPDTNSDGELHVAPIEGTA